VAQYRLEVKKKAIKELAKVRPDMGLKLLASIDSLASNPKPRQSHKLSGSTDSYRLRVGDYRVLYQIDNNAKIITVYQVGHRREVYR
jgi:mRNA interferase RelE/StbE